MTWSATGAHARAVMPHGQAAFGRQHSSSEDEKIFMARLLGK